MPTKFEKAAIGVLLTCLAVCALAITVAVVSLLASAYS